MHLHFSLVLVSIICFFILNSLILLVRILVFGVE